MLAPWLTYIRYQLLIEKFTKVWEIETNEKYSEKKSVMINVGWYIHIDSDMASTVLIQAHDRVNLLKGNFLCRIFAGQIKKKIWIVMMHATWPAWFGMSCEIPEHFVVWFHWNYFIIFFSFFESSFKVDGLLLVIWHHVA